MLLEWLLMFSYKDDFGVKNVNFRVALSQLLCLLFRAVFIQSLLCQCKSIEESLFRVHVRLCNKIWYLEYW